MYCLTVVVFSNKSSVVTASSSSVTFGSSGSHPASATTSHSESAGAGLKRKQLHAEQGDTPLVLKVKLRNTGSIGSVAFLR